MLLEDVNAKKEITISQNLLIAIYQEPIPRHLNLQLQRQRYGRLERFFKVEDNIYSFVLKTH
jgi:hypothetical protein